MKNVTVSLKCLYNIFDGQLKYGKIVKEVIGEDEYYDLQTDIGTVCMDGEACKIINSGSYGYEILNEEGEVEARFILTDEEYNVGVFKTVS